MKFSLLVALLGSLLGSRAHDTDESPITFKTTLRVEVNCERFFRKGTQETKKNLLSLVDLGNRKNFLKFTTDQKCLGKFATHCHLLTQTHIKQLLRSNNKRDDDNDDTPSERFRVLWKIGCLERIKSWSGFSLKDLKKIHWSFDVSKFRHWLEFDQKVLSHLLNTQRPSHLAKPVGWDQGAMRQLLTTKWIREHWSILGREFLTVVADGRHDLALPYSQMLRKAGRALENDFERVALLLRVQKVVLALLNAPVMYKKKQVEKIFHILR